MSKAFHLATTPTFEGDFKKLDPAVARRVLKKLKSLAMHPLDVSQPLRHLPHGLEGLRKYRVGDYRILFWVDPSHRQITLYAVAHRSVIYRSL